MRLNSLLFLAITAFLTSCSNSSSYEYRDISSYNLSEEALQDEEKIKLIYYSQGPDGNSDLSYYYHVIAISQSTGDTVNVFTFGDHGFKEGDQHKVFTFYGKDHFATKSVVSNMVENSEVPDISRVVYDPEYDYIAINQYPTVIGSIGTTP